jgi:hypothetical protein
LRIWAKHGREQHARVDALRMSLVHLSGRQISGG